MCSVPDIYIYIYIYADSVSGEKEVIDPEIGAEGTSFDRLTGV